MSGPPPALTSDEYSKAFDDVKTFGQQDGNAERDAMAAFWIAEGGTVREPGVWIQATVAIIEQQRTDRDLSDSARLLARVGMAVADAVMLGWETKATYFTWRPIFAIREADLDVNPATIAEPLWTPRNVSIGASPDTTLDSPPLAAPRPRSSRHSTFRAACRFASPLMLRRTDRAATTARAPRRWRADGRVSIRAFTFNSPTRMADGQDGASDLKSH